MKKLLLLFAFALSAHGQILQQIMQPQPTGGGASITFDSYGGMNASPGTAACATSPCTWTHTVGAGTHPFLVVQLSTELATTAACTYNGVSMTQAYTAHDSIPVGYIYAFILPAPASGAHTVSCTGTGFTNGVAYVSSSWFGVNQTGTAGTSYRTPVTANDGGTTSATVSVVVSNAVAGDVVLANFSGYGNQTVSSVSLTAIVSWSNIAFNSFPGGAQQKVTATGSTTATWNMSAAMNWVAGGLALIPG